MVTLAERQRQIAAEAAIERSRCEQIRREYLATPRWRLIKRLMLSISQDDAQVRVAIAEREVESIGQVR